MIWLASQEIHHNLLLPLLLKFLTRKPGNGTIHFNTVPISLATYWFPICKRLFGWMKITSNTFKIFSFCFSHERGQQQEAKCVIENS